MEILSILLIGLSLSMDCFSIAIAAGMRLKKVKFYDLAVMALSFGLFQFFTPIIGWFIGSGVEKYFTMFDHWVAAGLLFYIGGRMIFESWRDGVELKSDPFTFRMLMFLSLVTSIDAFCVGLSFAFLKSPVLFPAIIIGIITLVMSVIGINLGSRTGKFVGKRSGYLGGIVLIAIGIKILIEHLLL